MDAKQPNEDQGNQRNLEQCVQQVLACYQQQVNLTNIAKILPKPAAEFTVADLPLLAQKLNLQISTGQASYSQILNSQDPLIVYAQDEQDCWVFQPSLPDQQQVDASAEQQQNYAAQDTLLNCIQLKPRAAHSVVDTQHMEHQAEIDWFWQPFKNYQGSFIEILVCTLFINTFVLLIPLYTLNVYDQVIPNFAQETLIVLACGVILALLFDFALKTVRTYLLEKIAAEVGAKYDQQLMERIIAIHPERMALGIGERTNLFRELQGIREFYSAKLIPTAVDLPFCLLFMTVIYLISPPLTLVPITGAIIIVALNAGIQVPINRATAKYFANLQHKSALMLETLQGSQTFKLFNHTGARLFNWRSATQAANQSSRINQFLFGVAQNASLSMVHMVHVLIILFGVYQIQSGALTIGGLIACTILASRSIAPVVNIGNVVSRWQQSRDVLQVINSIFELPYENPLSRSSDTSLDGRLSFKNLSYTYPNAKRPSLQDLNINIEPGERVGLIGPTGAGKSTLATLCTGLFKNYDGEILFDGYNLENLSPIQLRDHIAFVPQQPFFIKGTIKENVLMGQTVVSDVDLDTALRLSGLDVVIKQTGFGLDTQVLEQAANLSGGQQQAISLARAFVRNPKILIMDEPTTGLDSALEARLRLGLHDFLADKTFIMITHRSSLLDIVNRLVLLDQGRVVKDGPRNDVLQALNPNKDGSSAGRQTAAS